MSKLEELIQELCPNGIQYHLIGDICDVLTGGEAPPESIKEKEPQGEYIYPIYSNGLGDNALWGYSKTFRIDKPAVTFSSIGTIGFPTLREAKFTPIIRLKVIYPKDANKLNICFLKYALEIVQFEKQKSSVANVNASMIKNIKIPVPPLEVQQEIVRILDEFTAKTAELQAELNKEYEARKKQYEYYRDTLLNNNAEIPKIKLGEFAVISRGGNFQKKDFVDNGLPCIHYGQIYTHYGTYADTTLTTINEEAYSKSKKAKKNDIVMAVTSENIEDVCKSVAWLGDKDIAVSGHTAIISHHQNAKYLSYYFSSNAFFKQKKKLAHGTKVIEVTPNTLANIEVPLPSLEVQNRLVEVLDNFDSICSDLNIDLPAEIETRQKQYEYYRDSLLTFAETGHIMPQTDRQTDRQTDKQ